MKKWWEKPLKVMGKGMKRPCGVGEKWMEIESEEVEMRTEMPCYRSEQSSIDVEIRRERCFIEGLHATGLVSSYIITYISYIITFEG